ncbi:CD226 antigen isoform X1 [Sorex araneus]|uniref:CD226 antigen isoform X1 n=1 Tax=Sorex araneus TaxID=42254 RepID=UPI002433CBE3|nr:CD226 antigen isoform X1 [Sorex araneus]
MDYLPVLLAILHAHKALGEEMFWDTTVRLAENMTLECVYPSAGILTQMEWFKINTTEKESIAIFNPTHGMDIREAYAEKVSFLNLTGAPNDMTLYFHNASEADVGFYSCSLHTFPYGSWEKMIRVVSFDDFEVIESPSHPVVSAPGKNVTLTCQLPVKWPVEKITWEKIQPHQIDLLTSCNLSQGRSYASKYHRQLWSPCSPGKWESSLTLPQATESDSGLYRCDFKVLAVENATCVIRLTVAYGKNDNLYILIVAGGTVLLLVLIIIITLITAFSFNRRRRQKRILFEKSWETQNKATNNYRSPISTNQLLDGTKEDVYVNFPTFSRRPKTRV